RKDLGTARRKNGEQNNATIEYEFFDVTAPIDTLTAIGNAMIIRDGVVVDRVPLYLDQDVSAINYKQSIEKVLDYWKIKKQLSNQN
ncbi:MAG: hypothetical protein IKC79_03000, partial [Clostridia bacterium]|nr:hypothetical protein [Clostridia bacterium]